jgi:GTP cyclohydrolase II
MKLNTLFPLLIVIVILIIIIFFLLFKNSNNYRISKWSKTQFKTKYNNTTVNCVVYCFKNNNKDEWAMVYGNPYLDEYPLIRIQSQCITGIELDDNECDCKQNFEVSKKMLIENKNGGILFLLNQDGKSHGGVQKLKEIYMRNIQHIQQETIIKELHHGNGDLRNYTYIPKMLSIIGVKNNVRLITRNPKKEEKLIEAGVVIKEVIPYSYHVTSRQNSSYLEMKKRLNMLI